MIINSSCVCMCAHACVLRACVRACALYICVYLYVHIMINQLIERRNRCSIRLVKEKLFILLNSINSSLQDLSSVFFFSISVVDSIRINLK